MSVWVTPSILAGSEDCRTNVETVCCETSSEAIVVIASGRSAWIPVDPWDDVVLETMVGLGSSEAFAQREIYAARTGVVLPLEQFEDV